MVEVLPEKQSEEVKFFPFCSQRCRLIDLGAWLDDKYKIISKSPDAPPNIAVDKR
jgi:endogenous inhibitor of DNA gyrase (YacG/DUF329 family)